MVAERFVVGIAGASGTVYGVRLLEALRTSSIETHLVMTPAAKQVAGLEMGKTGEEIEALADFSYPNDDMAASISSGSFLTMGMVMRPVIRTCRRSLNAVATLITRRPTSP